MVNLNRPESYVETARVDALTCEILIPRYREVPAIVCFHAQQCAEKLIKQVYVDNGDLPPRSHDLRELVRECCDNGYLEIDKRLDAAVRLGSHVTHSGYAPLGMVDPCEALSSVIHCNRISEVLREQGYASVEVDAAAQFLSDVELEGTELPLGADSRRIGRTREVGPMAATKNGEKRIRIPENLRTPFSQMVSDEAYLRATDESKAIIGLVFDKVLPSPAFPRDRMLDVYGGKSLFASVSDVLRSNVTGATGTVAHSDYKPIVVFGFDLFHERRCETAFFTGAMDMPHLRRCFDSVIDYMEQKAPRDPSDPFVDHETDRAVKYGRALMDEASTNYNRAPVVALVRFAIEYFDEIGQLNATCAYLADAFSALEESVTTSAAACGNRHVLPDTPESRRRLGRLLETVCADW